MFIFSSLWNWFYFRCYRCALWFIEHGLLPDFITRYGIRFLLRERLQIENTGSTNEILQRKLALVEKFKTMPIAIETEAANEQHYEVPAKYFDICLGKWKKYSSCLYKTPKDSVDTAEENMLSLYCVKAEIEDGMRLLDLGCGWGSLTLFLGSAYPSSQIVGVSNSHAQKAYIDATAQKLGLINVQIITCDINQFNTDQEFDRILSIEMFEHMKNYKLLLEKISTWLKPNGKLFVHYFCHKTFLYEFKVQREDDWMANYFFTGGTMPSLDLLLYFQDDLTVKSIDFINGVTYSRTLEEWLRQMDHNKSEILQVFEATYEIDFYTWYIRWRLFYLACSELFKFEKGEEWGIAHILMEHRNRKA